MAKLGLFTSEIDAIFEACNETVYLADLTSLSGTEFVISGTNRDGIKIIGQDFTMSNYQNPATGVNHIKYQPEGNQSVVSISYGCLKFRNVKQIFVTVNGVKKAFKLDQVYSNYGRKRINFVAEGDVLGINKMLGKNFSFTISLG